jgi:hypothetical protein
VPLVWPNMFKPSPTSRMACLQCLCPKWS